jgi:hypothetical protein
MEEEIAMMKQSYLSFRWMVINEHIPNMVGQGLLYRSKLGLARRTAGN